MPSRATIKSLLVTPNSFARSITFTRPATVSLPPPPVVHDLRRTLSRRHHHASECVRQTPPRECFLETLDRPARVRPASGRGAWSVNDDPSVTPSSQPEQLGLRPDSPAPDARAARPCLHSAGAGRALGSAEPPNPCPA